MTQVKAYLDGKMVSDLGNSELKINDVPLTHGLLRMASLIK